MPLTGPTADLYTWYAGIIAGDPFVVLAPREVRAPKGGLVGEPRLLVRAASTVVAGVDHQSDALQAQLAEDRRARLR